MKKLVIFGTAGISKLAHFYFQKDSDYEVVAFCVDAEYRDADRFCDLPVVDFDNVAELYAPSSHDMFIAVSYAKMNQVRADKYFAAKEKGYKLASYVSSHCTYLSEDAPGENCFILEDNTIQPFVKIGNNVTLWSGNHIGHDAVIGDHSFVSSHVVISGNVVVGESCFLGVNSTFHNDIKIGDKSLISAGALVKRDTKEKEVYLAEAAKLFPKTSDRLKI